MKRYTIPVREPAERRKDIKVRWMSHKTISLLDELSLCLSADLDTIEQYGDRDIAIKAVRIEDLFNELKDIVEEL